jgi:hypothetical protein
MEWNSLRPRFFNSSMKGHAARTIELLLLQDRNPMEMKKQTNMKSKIRITME